jgi:hypothetical protein
LVFSHAHIAVTGVVTGAISAAIAIWRIDGGRR